MDFKTASLAEAEPKLVFDAFHHYKVDANPARFFPTKLVRWHYQVLTEQTLGQRAIYEMNMVVKV